MNGTCPNCGSEYFIADAELSVIQAMVDCLAGALTCNGCGTVVM